MSDVLRVLGIDLEELDWQDLALCDGMDTELFYDKYESSESVAKMIDEACLSCPIMAQCLERGVENSEWGVWGGIYLSTGTVDPARNKHKTQDVWDQIRERIGESSL